MGRIFGRYSYTGAVAARVRWPSFYDRNKDTNVRNHGGAI